MSKKVKTKESEPAAGQSPAQAKPGTKPPKVEAAPPPAGGAAPHDDAAQDTELIKSMLDKYVGGGDHDQETMSAAHEAYQAAKEAGMEGEEAEKAVGYGMKMAKIMKQKADALAQQQAEAEAEAEESEAEESESEESESEAKESRKDVAKLKGQVAMLESKLRSKDLAEYLDTKLKESGLNWHATKKFRENLGTPKSEKQIDTELKHFTEGYKLAGGEASSPILGAERQSIRESGKGISFKDCKG